MSWNTALDAPAVHVGVCQGNERLRIVFQDGCRFEMDAAGTEIDVHWTRPQTRKDAMAYALGSVFGLLLRFRGRVALHASAVRTHHGTVLLAAPSGTGKSTLAAAFGRRGASVLTDDLAVVTETGSGFATYRGGSGVKLWPDTATAVLGPLASGAAIAPHWPKHVYALPGSQQADWFQPIPISAIVLLVRPGPGSLRRVSPRPALERLAALLHPDIRIPVPNRYHVHAFPVLTRLSVSLPVLELGVPDDLGELDTPCEQLEAWLESHAPDNESRPVPL